MRMIRPMSSNSLNGNLTGIEGVRISNPSAKITKWKEWRGRDKVRYNSSTKIKSTQKTRETLKIILMMTMRTLIVRVMMRSSCLISNVQVRSIKCKGIPPSNSSDQASLPTEELRNTAKINSDIIPTIAMISKKSAKKTSMDQTTPKMMNRPRNLSWSLCQQLAPVRKAGFTNG